MTDERPAVALREEEPRFDRLLEYAIALLLGVGAILIAWSSYQSALWGGESLTQYTQAIRSSDAASQAWNEAFQTDVQDQNLFLQYATAVATGQQELGDYVLQTLMRPELVEAIGWWAEQPEGAQPSSPFVDENPSWTNEALERAVGLDEQAEGEFLAGSEANSKGDAFTLVTVFMAVALFLLGVAAVLKGRLVRVALVVGAAAVLGYSTIQLLGLGIYPG
jgi:hypothetical protein